MKLWLRRQWLFVAMVLVPTLGAIMYYGLIASDVYVSESRFLVRNPQNQSSSGVVGALLQGTGLGGHSENDSSSVHDYILSRDALTELDKKLDMRKSFSKPDIDLFDRFPGLGLSRSFEKFYLYYGKHVAIESDSASSISVLTVRAFTAEDAYKINHALLDISERLVNTLNDRSRRDLIDFADHEVKIASDKAKDASHGAARRRFENTARTGQHRNRGGPGQEAFAGQSANWRAHGPRRGFAQCDRRRSLQSDQ
jgi:capsular polysaccharide transport system permease protein